MTKKLADTLGVNLPELLDDEPEPIVVSVSDQGLANNVQTDYEYARENQYKAIEIAMRALQDLSTAIHRDTEKKQGRFEAMATLLNSFASLNKGLIDLTEQRAQIDLEEEPKEVEEAKPKMISSAEALRQAKQRKGT